MSTIEAPRPLRRKVSLAVAPIDVALAIGAVAILVAVLAALARGHAQWGSLPWTVWLHLVTILVALVLTPIMLLRRRGDAPHRLLGRIWIAAMLGTALISLFIKLIHPGGFSPIHLLSVLTLVSAPLAGWFAHRGQIEAHRQTVRGIITGALLIAGFFTFPFGRLLGRWLYG